MALEGEALAMVHGPRGQLPAQQPRAGQEVSKWVIKGIEHT